MSLYTYLVSKNPILKKKMRIAKITKSPEEYVKKAFMGALQLGVGFGILSFFILNKNESHLVLPFFIGFITFYMFYGMNIKKLDVKINKRAKQIDKTVLFAGRFLLIKLNSGDPLVNAIDEAAKSYGVASEYFGEIIREIELGTPIEGALEIATEYCPSKHLKKILFQITNALKIGIDVSDFLEATLDEIADEQLVEIIRYGKKLSSLTMFYMLIAVIVPSLGMTMFVIIASLISINLDMLGFSAIVGALAFIQFIFITLFRGARPNMEV